MKHILLLLCILSLVPLNHAHGKSKGKNHGKSHGKSHGKTQPKKEPIKISADEPTIGAVSGDSITVGKQTYSISGKTQISLDGNKAAAGALKTGMRASVTASGIERGAAMSITAYSGK